MLQVGTEHAAYYIAKQAWLLLHSRAARLNALISDLEHDALTHKSPNVGSLQGLLRVWQTIDKLASCAG